MNNAVADFKNKRVLLMGLGLNRGGLETAKWLVKRGADLTVTDLKTEDQLAPTLAELEKYDIKYVLGRHRKADFISADLVVKGQGIPSGNEYLAAARKAGVPVETDISIFFRLCRAKRIIGITGTKGKSTATAITGEIFKETDPRAAVGGNIGISPIAFLDKVRPETPVVLELSSWQLEGLSIAKRGPDVAAVTNIYRDHLNYYGTMPRYIAAKKEIVRHQDESGTAVLNLDDPVVRKFGGAAKGRVLWFSRKKNPRPKSLEGIFIENGILVSHIGGKREEVLPLAKMRLKGDHNVLNAALAVCIALACKVDRRAIKKVLREFSGVPHRMESLGKTGGLEFINDTAATIPDAAISAIRALGKKGRIVLLGGGMDKKLEFSKFAEEIKANCRFVVLFSGTGTDKLTRELKKIGYFDFGIACSMKEAFAAAVEFARKGDKVLLSPGCASFGLFANEFDRGDQFKKEVTKLR